MIRNRGSQRTTGRTTAVVCTLFLQACGFPTENSSSLSVELLSEDVLIVVGQTSFLSARVTGGEGAGDLPIVFRSSDESVVRVSPNGSVRGIGRGEARVSASLRAFEGAGSDSVEVRVIPNVVIESVSPTTVRYGDVVTVVGTTLDPARLSVLAVGGWEAPVHSFVRADLDQPTSRDTLRIWTPAGAAAEGTLVALHEEGATATWPMSVMRGDLYEPNDDQPAAIASPFTLTNPQLSFEAGSGFDWYRLHGIDGTFTIDVQLRLPVQAALGKVTVSAPRAERDAASPWSWADDLPGCYGLTAVRERAYFTNVNATDDVLSFPILDPDVDSLDLTIEMFGAPAEDVSYAVTVRPGYLTTVDPDEYEPNNHCGQATELPPSFEGTVSFDGPVDDDWFSFTVEEDSWLDALLTCVRCDEAYFMAFLVYENTAEGSPEAPEELPRVFYDYSGGDLLEARVFLPAGEYFMLVHNEFYFPLEEVSIRTSLTPAN